MCAYWQACLGVHFRRFALWQAGCYRWLRDCCFLLLPCAVGLSPIFDNSYNWLVTTGPNRTYDTTRTLIALCTFHQALCIIIPWHNTPPEEEYEQQRTRESLALWWDPRQGDIGTLPGVHTSPLPHQRPKALPAIVGLCRILLDHTITLVQIYSPVAAKQRSSLIELSRRASGESNTEVQLSRLSGAVFASPLSSLYPQQHSPNPSNAGIVRLNSGWRQLKSQ